MISMSPLNFDTSNMLALRRVIYAAKNLPTLILTSYTVCLNDVDTRTLPTIALFMAAFFSLTVHPFPIQLNTPVGPVSKMKQSSESKSSFFNGCFAVSSIFNSPVASDTL